jgi:hypothetical protein
MDLICTDRRLPAFIERSLRELAILIIEDLGDPIKSDSIFAKADVMRREVGDLA